MFILYFSAAVAVIRNISVLVWQVGTYTVHMFKFARAFSLITFKFFCFVLYFSKAKNSFSCFFLHSFYIFLTLLFCRRLLLFFLLVSLGIWCFASCSCRLYLLLLSLLLTFFHVLLLFEVKSKSNFFVVPFILTVYFFASHLARWYAKCICVHDYLLLY